jgi:hypothetical protein
VTTSRDRKIACWFRALENIKILTCRWYNPPMTLLEITYKLQSPLSIEQLGLLGEFANTYGLRRFRVDEKLNHLTFEYDASRLRETQVTHVLGKAGIAITEKISENGSTDPLQ